MNEDNIKPSLYNNIRIFIKKNNKNIIFFILCIFIIFIIFQYYLYSKNKNVLNTSIIYNETFSNGSIKSEFKNILSDLENEDNFYGVLASMDLIKSDLENGDFNLAYERYKKLLDRKKLSNLYKSAISIHGSYSILNIVNLTKKLNTKDKKDLIDKINSLLAYVDDEIISYFGLKLEILYLVSIYKNEDNKNSISEESKLLFQQLLDNDKVTSSIKERVKKIHEFQKYK